MAGFTWVSVCESVVPPCVQVLSFYEDVSYVGLRTTLKNWELLELFSDFICKYRHLLRSEGFNIQISGGWSTIPAITSKVNAPQTKHAELECKGGLYAGKLEEHHRSCGSEWVPSPGWG